MGKAVDDAQLAADLAKIDLAVAQARERLGDDRLTMEDVSAIAHVSEHFGVTERMAYNRAKEFDLLSWQAAANKDRTP